VHMPVAVEDGVEEARTRVLVACGGQHGGGLYGSARASPRLRQHILILSRFSTSVVQEVSSPSFFISYCCNAS